jgi:hypothetical protein
MSKVLQWLAKFDQFLSERLAEAEEEARHQNTINRNVLSILESSSGEWLSIQEIRNALGAKGITSCISDVLKAIKEIRKGRKVLDCQRGVYQLQSRK